ALRDALSQLGDFGCLTEGQDARCGQTRRRIAMSLDLMCSVERGLHGREGVDRRLSDRVQSLGRPVYGALRAAKEGIVPKALLLSRLLFLNALRLLIDRELGLRRPVSSSGLEGGVERRPLRAR